MKTSHATKNQYNLPLQFSGLGNLRVPGMCVCRAASLPDSCSPQGECTQLSYDTGQPEKKVLRKTSDFVIAQSLQ